jgi:murein DD-endopeptidase MepM/ murein hydrolase activator NlpD
MAYVYPTAVTNVSDSFQDHVNRGSVNPGTDYTSAYGDTVSAVAAGTVADASNSPSGGGGRTVHVNHDDGTGADYLHLSSVAVRAGQWISQGTRIGQSGASGYGDDWYYGPHLHISFRPNHAGGYGNNGNQDFDAIMKSQKPPVPPKPPVEPEEEEEIMRVGQVHYTNADGHIVRALYAPGSAYWMPWQDDTAGIANGFAKSLETGASVAVTESLYNALARAAEKLL